MNTSEVSRWQLFRSSVFFVLGFSVFFALLGVLLQTLLASSSYTISLWLSRIGGLVIIAFGLFLMGLFHIKFLEKEVRFEPKRRFLSADFTSFVFGAAFAAGWSPCVGAVLGAMLTLAATHPGQSFILLLAYAVGLGIPFLLVGLFAEKARYAIKKFSKIVVHAQKFFGALLVVIGVLVFVQNLSFLAATFSPLEFFFSLDSSLSSSLNIGVALLAGVISFLSPCVFPLVPAYLSYLAAVAIKK